MKYCNSLKTIGIKKILFLMLLMNCFLGTSQNDEAFVNSQVAQKMAQLEMQENPEYFSRKDFCVGNIQIFVMPDGARCAPPSTYYSVYVFWEETEKFKLQKFDNCGSFIPLTIENEKLLKKIHNIKDALGKDAVILPRSDAENERSTANMSVQSCYKEYIFKLQGETFQKSFEENNLINDSESKTLKHNKSLSIINLDKEISKLILELEIKGKFFREK